MEDGESLGKEVGDTEVFQSLPTNPKPTYKEKMLSNVVYEASCSLWDSSLDSDSGF